MLQSLKPLIDLLSWLALPVTLIAALVLGEIDGWASGSVGLAAMGVVVAAIAWWCRPLGGAIVAGIAWLMFNGFVVHELGELHWHGFEELRRIAILCGIGLAASLARSVKTAAQGRIALSGTIRSRET